MRFIRFGLNKQEDRYFERFEADSNAGLKKDLL